jgi:AcrR family transcriptional regulator
MKRVPTDNARERIIDAAEQVVIEAGAGHLTLEAVASKAGVSRGGLLYHFPDKEALLKGMLDRLKRQIDEGRTKRRSELPAGPDRESIVYVQTFLTEGASEYRHVTAAILASGAHAPELLAKARENCRQSLNDLTRDGLRSERAAVIMLATHGLRLMEMLSLSPFDAEERVSIVTELLALANMSSGS